MSEFLSTVFSAATQREVRTKNTGVAQREAQSEAQGWRRGGAWVAQGLRRDCAGVAQGLLRTLGAGGGAGVAQVWRRCDQHPAANFN